MTFDSYDIDTKVEVRAPEQDELEDKAVDFYCKEAEEIDRQIEDDILDGWFE